MKYNWREQEKTYQPWRVKVAKTDRRGRWGSDTYLVLAYNETTHEIEPFDTSGQGNHRRYSTKVKAIKAAQWWAEQRHLPFIASRDFTDYDTLKAGPVLHCVVCSFAWRRAGELVRGWEATACPDCKAKATAYDNEHAEVITYKVGKQGVINNPGSWYAYQDSDKLVLMMLLQIASPLSQITGGTAYKAEDVVIGGRSTGFRYDIWEFPTQEWRLKALGLTIDAINDTIQTAFKEGVKNGSSLLQKLARGEVHPNDFSDARMGKKKRE